jgi:hypothetical protein
MSTKELGIETLPLRDDVLIKSMRMINKIMSTKLLHIWCMKCWPYLESAKIELSKAKNYDYSSLYLYPHEYLCLISNAQDRIQKLKNMQKPDFKLHKK